MKLSLSVSGIRRVVADLLRPTGFSAMTVEYLDESAQS